MQNTPKSTDVPSLSPPQAESQGEGVTSEPLSLANLKIPCRHLRSKEMYYQEYGAADDEFSSGVYWCGKTQENFGPDGQPCSRGDCSGERTCYLA